MISRSTYRQQLLAQLVNFPVVAILDLGKVGKTTLPGNRGWLWVSFVRQFNLEDLEDQVCFAVDKK